MPSAVATRKVRLRNRVIGMIGSAALFFFKPKTAYEITRAASSDTACHEPQPSRPPTSVNRTSDVVVADSATMPATSMGDVLRLRGRVRANQPMASTATPTGTLIQNAHSQPRAAESVKKPPTSGPTIAESPN